MNGELLAKLLKLCLLCLANDSSCRHSSLPLRASRQITARLPGPVSAVSTSLSRKTTGDDQPVPAGTFQTVLESSIFSGNPLASITPVPLGPRKRDQSSARAVKVRALRPIRVQVASGCFMAVR